MFDHGWNCTLHCTSVCCLDFGDFASLRSRRYSRIWITCRERKGEKGRGRESGVNCPRIGYVCNISTFEEKMYVLNL